MTIPASTQSSTSGKLPHGAGGGSSRGDGGAAGLRSRRGLPRRSSAGRA